MTILSRPLVAALLLGLVAMPAHGQSVTKTEIRRDPPAITNRRLRDMIWGMLEHRDLRTAKPPRAMLTDLRFETKPYAAHIRNLCRYDALSVAFGPDDPNGPHDADTPVHAQGADTQSYFRFLKAPPLEPSNDDYVGAPASGACASADKAGFFTASSEDMARDGYRALLKLQQALRGKSAVPLHCDLDPTDKQTCADIILAFRQEDLNVSACDVGQEGECFVVEGDGREVRIVLSRGNGTAIPEGALVRASLESMIIIADTRTD